MDEQTQEPGAQPAGEQVAAPAAEPIAEPVVPVEESVTFRTAVSWGGDTFNLAPGETCSLPKSIALARVEAGLGTIDDGSEGSKGKRKR